MFNIILFNPQIPPNTGNIVRLSVNTGCSLHLIKPLGFSVDQKSYRRAGLDYHDISKVNQYDNLNKCLDKIKNKNFYAITKFGKTCLDKVKFEKNDAFIFGSETNGLPKSFLNNISEEKKLYIPMVKGARSLNLSNAVSLVIYEAWRQIGYDGAQSFDK